MQPLIFWNASRGPPQGHRASIWCAIAGKAEDPCASLQSLISRCNHVIIACITLHSMIIEEDCDTQLTNEYLFDNIQDGFLVDNVKHNDVHTFLDFKAIRMNYMNECEHYQL